jgi:hypothetical protein
MVDSGASDNVLAAGLFSELGLSFHHDGGHCMFMADGTPLPVHGCISLPVKFGALLFHRDFKCFMYNTLLS